MSLHQAGHDVLAYLGGWGAVFILAAMFTLFAALGLASLLWDDRRDRRERQQPPPVQDGQQIWDRTRLTAGEYTALAAIEAEEKAAEQEHRSGDGGRRWPP